MGVTEVNTKDAGRAVTHSYKCCSCVGLVKTITVVIIVTFIYVGDQLSRAGGVPRTRDLHN